MKYYKVNVSKKIQFPPRFSLKTFFVAVASMKRGEKCILTCQPDYAYGKRGELRSGFTYPSPNEGSMQDLMRLKRIFLCVFITHPAPLVSTDRRGMVPQLAVFDHMHWSLCAVHSHPLCSLVLPPVCRRRRRDPSQRHPAVRGGADRLHLSDAQLGVRTRCVRSVGVQPLLERRAAML